MEYDGASPSEILLDACHKENPNLLNQILDDPSTDIFLINNSRDGLGNTSLHLSVQYGSIACLNILLDVENLEINSKNFLEENTPLHKAVEYQYKDKDIALEMVESLIDAGADPRIKNKMKQKPIDLVDQRHTSIRDVLKRAELVYFTSKNDIQSTDNESEAFSSDS
ncbi:hypothetical protein T552_00093 [Pneumocystis carinii B80]|uniref:Uncharacterized protein n=1 Tax=Pneumocystis carinii (strain B80) TaxID=1408658 RepID=A0A0W4ZST4_PNEC8|nr:hypothetical protein T552_00093 [Pneumocystis carinii B80]KTW31451.1 hypothetical protein T552_00093 [Pneumocystis carinii B80]